MSSFVHASAVVDDGAELGPGVKVWHFCHVSAGALIGAGTSLGQNVFVAKNVRVGARVKIQNNVSLYEGVEIGDDVFLGPSCVFTNVVNPRAFIERKREFRPTRVGVGATVGANATIVCGHEIGAYAFVAAGATVTRDVPAHALVMGTPARIAGWMCRCGERLPSGGDVRCAACGERFHIDGAGCLPQEPRAAQGAHESLEAGAQRELRVPMLDLHAQHAPLHAELRAAFDRVLASERYILGPELDAFEAELCAQLGFRHAITVSSGTDALLLALMALEIAPGDEVITTPFSFFATAGAIARLGARPVFVDIDPSSFNLDPERVEAALTPRTRALLPVHLFGQPAELPALRALAERRGLALVEDGAQALGATYAEQAIGTFGAFGCFSFFPSKNLGGFGDGGLVVTGDSELAERARMLRAHGSRPKYHHLMVGGNFRLDALQAALLRVKLPHLAGYNDARRAHAAFYDQRLAAIAPGLLLTPRRLELGHVYNQYVLRTPRRDELRAALTEAQIETEIYYPRCLHLQPCFAALGYREGDLPEAERAAREVLAIPIYPELTPAQREHVAGTIQRFFQREA